MYIKTLLSRITGLLLICILPDMAHATPQRQADSLLQLLPRIKEDSNKVKIYSKLAGIYAPDDRRKGLLYANRAMELARRLSWTKGIGNAFIDRSQVYFYNSDYGPALQDAQHALDICRRIGYKKGMAVASTSIGNVYISTGYYEEAIEHNLIALCLFEELDLKAGEANVYLNLAASYMELKDYPKSLQYYDKALALFRELHNNHGIASVLDNIGSVYYLMKDYSKAAAYYAQSAPVFEATQERYELAKTYNNLGNVFVKRKMADSSYWYYTAALKINKEQGNKAGMAYNYGGLGELYSLLATEPVLESRELSLGLRGNSTALLKISRQQFEKAYALAEETGNINLMMHNAAALAAAEEELGNTAGALSRYKDYTRFKDSIFNDENKRKIAGLELKRLTEVKDKEILLLQKNKQLQNISLRKQREALLFLVSGIILIVCCAILLFRSYNRRKKAFFSRQVAEVELQMLRLQINPHFIFNALQAVNKYILDNNKNDASEFLARFSKLMRMTLEHSAEQEVTLSEDIEVLQLYLELESLRFKDKFVYDIEIAPEIDAEHTLIPPMLLQPFVENAIVHGLQSRENGFIHIKIEKAGDRLRCIVEDNGRGRQDTTMVHTGNKQKSMGIKITRERLRVIEQLKHAKTTIHFRDLKDGKNEPSGLLVELTLPYLSDY